MPVDFNAIIDKQLSNELPPKMRRFLTPRKQPSGFEQTWNFYAFAFERAFEIMAEDYCQRYPNQDYLLIPLMQMARHSMELALKNAISECTFFSKEPLKVDGHGLLVLYDRLNRFLVDMGIIEDDDEWTAHSRKFLIHIDQVDRTGEVFRYPTDLDGNRFDVFDIDMEGLIAAHHHITTLADATVTMLREIGGYPDERDYWSY